MAIFGNSAHARVVLCMGLAAAGCLFSFAATAQGIFCPGTIAGVGTGFALSGGLCTNGQTGAFSSAALSSQAIGDIQQSTTEQSTTTALDAVSARRKEETERCGEGFERVNGVCQRTSTSEPDDRRKSSSEKPRRRAADGSAPKSGLVYVKAPPIPIDPGYRYGAWARGFGDYERRTDFGTSALFSGGGGGGGVGGGPVAQNLGVSLAQQTTTVGGVGGVDITFRNLVGKSDGLIVGVLTGYISSDISLSGTVRPIGTITDPTVGVGSSSGKVNISGPSIGGYYTYFNGAFSNDTMLKVDFLSINESFSEIYAFNVGFGFGANSGTGSANVTNFVAASNYQYRFPLSSNLWFEPTAGYRYTNSNYDAGAAALGLENGYDWRVQGGGRFGIESMWNGVHVTTTITGLAYSDVVIVGGPITSGASGAFVGSTVLPSDQGKLRGEGIFVANFDLGRGASTFVQADVRGGSGLVGGGGQAGFRVQF